MDQLSGLALPHHDSNARMPNVARLARSGVTFSHAYTGAMTCGPSRACLDTGLFTQMHSVGGGYRPPASMETLPKTLARTGFILSHPDGYSLEAERAELKVALESARTSAVASTQQLAAEQAALVSARERTAQLEAALAAGAERTGQLESELAKVRGEMEDWGTALGNAQRERYGHLTAIAAGEARVREIEQQAAQTTAAMSALRTQADAGAARMGELEGDLRASGEAVNRLESEARSREARIAELEKATQMWRAALEEMRLNSTDIRPRAALRNVAPRVGEDEPPAHAEAVPDGAVRLLIQTAGGREIVHVLGRRTCIGRTPENDLQIEANCVSRRHAIILTGSRHTVIEDLHSTNGVLVNGKRVTRQLLKDGDDVLIGLSHYRFAVHRAAEKR